MVDEKRSAVLTAQAKSFPDNTELEAMLNLVVPAKVIMYEVAADPKNLRLQQHISLVRLPENYQSASTILSLVVSMLKQWIWNSAC